MPIYDKPVRLLFPEMIEELKFSAGRAVRSKEILSWFWTKYPKINPHTVNAHLTKMTTNARSRKWHKVDPKGSHDIFFKTNAGEYRLYNAVTDPRPIYPTENQSSVTSRPPVDVSPPKKDRNLSNIPSDNELDDRRRKVVKILRSLDKSDDGPSTQLGRLKRKSLIPRHIASLIFVILEYRNVLVYEDYRIVDENEALVVNAAWSIIDEWARGEGLLVEKL